MCLPNMALYDGQSLHEAVKSGDVDKVRELLEGGKCNVNCVVGLGWTPLHEAAYCGHLGVVRVLISEFKAEVDACTGNGETPLHQAAYYGHLSVVRLLISEFKADVEARTDKGYTILHWAALRGHSSVVRVLVSEFKANVSACTGNGETPFHKAVTRGQLGVVRVLISEFNINVDICTNQGTAFDLAVINKREDVALALMNEFHCNTNGGTPYIRTACERGWVNLVRGLVHKHGTGIFNGDCTLLYDTLLDQHKVAVMLVKEFRSTVKDLDGRSLLHIACIEGDVGLVQTLIHDGKADVTARDNEGNTTLHVAAMSGRENVVLSLINEFGCDVNETGHLGRSLLHSACVSNNFIVRLVSQYISPWVVDDNGDTPLHICARLGYTGSVKALLELDPPVMVRNNLGQTPRDLEKTRKEYYNYTGDIETYMKENKGKIYSQYDVIQSHAKKKYSLPEPITRAFVVGNPGAGKSSFIEALKREGFVDSFKRVSESSVPPHTAGIVPSITPASTMAGSCSMTLQEMLSITLLMLPFSRILLPQEKVTTFFLWS